TATWAVFGFLRAMLEMIKTRKPECLAVSFDLPGATFRDDMYEKYKSHRPPMPDDLQSQLPLIREVVERFGIPIYTLAGFEADDVIGSIAKRAARNGQTVYILTGDQDTMQLVEEHIRVLTPQSGVDGLVEYGPDTVLERYGVTPEQFIDYKALIGDTSDNIPGVPGIGPKTAVKLLEQFQTVDNLVANIDKVKPDRIRDLIANNLELLRLSHTLSAIITDVEVDFDQAKCKLTPPPDIQALRDLLARLEFNTLLRELPETLKHFGVMDGAAPAATPDAEGPAGEGPGDSDALWFDFQADSTPAARPPTLNMTIVTDPADLPDLVRRLAQGPFAIDTETTNVRALQADLVGISLALSPEPGATTTDKLDSYYLPVGHALPTDTVAQLPLEATLAALRPVLEDPTIGKIGHNLKYDINVFSRYGIHLRGVADDSMIADYILDPERAHGLKEAALGQLGYTMTPITALIGTGVKAITMDKVLTEPPPGYAAADAAVTFELSHLERTKIGEMGLLDLYENIELPLVVVLAHMEQHGVALDVEHLRRLSKQLAEQIGALEQKVCLLVGREFNLNSPKQLSVVLFEDLQLPTAGIKKNPSGGFSTDAAMLEKLAPKHEAVRMILEYRQLTKLKSTYADSLPELIHPVTKRLHTSLNQTVAATGRLSSTDPNLQNIPVKSELGREIRRAFVAGNPDGVLMSADYSQIELRLLAHYSEDPAFLEAFRQGEDIHRRTAAEIFGMNPEQVTSDLRRIAKTVNFGIAYGQTAFGLAQTLNVPQKEVATIIERFRTRYPRVQQFVTQMIAFAKENGFVTTLTGRRRFLPDAMSPNRNLRELAERMAVNTPLQGTAADIIKMAMIQVHDRLPKSGLSARMILQVHDELVFELPKDEIEPLKALIRPIMEGVMQLKVPLQVDINTAANWMEAK
ncbi:MAG: DNA polymerase I, partial [Candidatus Sericytochromatia bacterium]|nr:DNA polymerase I [Candidatus Sericytochromatia bacterium]